MAAAQPVPCALPDQAEFDQMSLTEIGTRFINDRVATIAWSRQYWLLARDTTCPNCGAQCREQLENKIKQCQSGSLQSPLKNKNNY